MPNADGAMPFLELMENIDDMLGQVVREEPTPALTRRALALRSQLPSVIARARRQQQEHARNMQELARKRQEWAGREEEREAMRDHYLKSVAPTGAPMYVMCWKPASNHWRGFWLVGPFDGLESATQWARDYIEEDEWFAVEWNGELRVLSPTPIEGLL